MGTLFAGTNLPLRLWFETVWHVANQKYGATAFGMQRILLDRNGIEPAS